MVGSDSCLSQAGLCGLQKPLLAHPCEPLLLSGRAAWDVWAAGRRIPELCCPDCVGMAAHSPWVFCSCLAAIPKEGKHQTGAGVKSEAACVTFLCCHMPGQNSAWKLPGLLPEFSLPQWSPGEPVQAASPLCTGCTEMPCTGREFAAGILSRCSVRRRREPCGSGSCALGCSLHRLRGEAALDCGAGRLSWHGRGNQAASVPCPCCHVPGRGTGSLAAAVLCPSAEQATLAVAVAHLLPLLLSRWHRAPADAVPLPLGWHCLPGASRTLRACLREPLISLKLPRGTRGCKKCPLCVGTTAPMGASGWPGTGAVSLGG